MISILETAEQQEMSSHDQNFWTTEWNQRSEKWAEKKALVHMDILETQPVHVGKIWLPASLPLMWFLHSFCPHDILVAVCL